MELKIEYKTLGLKEGVRGDPSGGWVLLLNARQWDFLQELLWILTRVNNLERKLFDSEQAGNGATEEQDGND